MSNFLIKISEQYKNLEISKRRFKLILSIATSALEKGFNIISTLVTIPITLNYLGATQFGIWMVITGLTTFVSFGDLGIGMGLQNALSKAYGKGEEKSYHYYISSAYFISFILCFLLSFLIFICYEYLSFDSIFILDAEQDLTIASETLFLCILAFIVGIPINLMQRILTGFQKTYVANSVLLFGKFISLLFIVISVYFDLGLKFLAISFVLSPIISMLIYSIFFFSKNYELLPSFRTINVSYIKKVMGGGVWTIFVQFIFSAKINIPTVIISSTVSMIAVSEYSIAQKLVGVGMMVINVALQPLWTVYGEAYYSGDKNWVEKTLYNSIKIVFIITILLSIFNYFFGQKLINLWLGGEIIPPSLLILMFSLWMIATSINVCFAMLLNGTGNFRNQALISMALVSIALAVSYIACRRYESIGVVFSMFFISELLRIPFFYMEAKKVISRI